MKRFLLASFAVLAMFAQANAEIITQWNFNGSSTEPSTGVGTISTIGGVINPSFNSGAGSSDSVQPGFGYQTDNYRAQSLASGTAGIRVNANTVGFQNIIGSFDLRLSNTSSRWFAVQYTTDGTNFISFGSPVRIGGTATNGDAFFNGNTFDLSSISGVNNNPNFGFQVVSVFSPVAFTQVNSNINYAANTAYEVARNPTTGTNSAYGTSGGTWRFDMVTVNATAVPEPTSIALLGMIAGVGVVGARFRKRVARK